MNDFDYKNINSVKGFGNDILYNILKSRGIVDVNRFLNLNESVLEDYKDYDNIKEGTEIYMKHIENDDIITILVDFDSDGYNSASVMYLYTIDIYKKLNKPYNIKYVLHKHKSHGLDADCMKDILNTECKLLIIPDAGSNNFEYHKILKEKGIDIICLDHHQCSKYSENAIVVNNQMSNKIHNKSMTGVGVVYKFCKYIDEILDVNFADKYIDLVAIGMIADHSDLRNMEARYLVLNGLKLIQANSNHNKLIQAIYKNKSYSMNNKVTINGVAFYIAPAINCIIRGGTNEEKEILFKAFIGSNETYTDTIRGKGEVELSIEDYVVRLYGKLKRKQDKIVNNAVEILSKQIEDYKLNNYEIMIIDGREIEDNTYNRVIINKLSDKYKKHGILLTTVKNEGDCLGGSASGCKNKSITNFRQWCKDTKLFKMAEGHPNAFGSKILKDNIQSLYNLIAKIPSDNKLIYRVDGVYTDKSLNEDLVKMISTYNDLWGNELDEPLFAIENINIPSKDIFFNEGKTQKNITFLYNGIKFYKFKATKDEYAEIIKNENNKFTFIGKFNCYEKNGYIYSQIVIEDYKYVPTKETVAFRF